MAKIANIPVPLPPRLEKSEVDTVLQSAIKRHGKSIEQMSLPSTPKGLELLLHLASSEFGRGPTPQLTADMAIQRNLRDRTILYGMKWLLEQDVFDCNGYTVHWDADDAVYEIEANVGHQPLRGRAFFEAESGFEERLTEAQNDLDLSGAAVKLILASSHDLSNNFRPDLAAGQFLVLVDINNGDAKGFAGAGVP